MNKSFKVESSNVTKNNNYCNKLVNKTTVNTQTPFGVTVSEQQETYYLFTATINKVGFEAPLDIALFDVVEKPFSFTDEAGKPVVAQLKYLYPKR